MMKHYCIIDLKHTMAISASEQYDGEVHHANPKSADYSLWTFEPADEPNAYYIRDLRHRKYIHVTEDYDGRVYHGDARGESARWHVFPMYDGPGGAIAVTIKDGKHGLALVASDDPDGIVHHEAPEGRMNAFWTLVPIDR
jgi:hypothetical protein